MVSLIEYRHYWEGILERIPEIRSLIPVTVDQDISHHVSSITVEELPFE